MSDPGHMWAVRYDSIRNVFVAFPPSDTYLPNGNNGHAFVPQHAPTGNLIPNLNLNNPGAPNHNAVPPNGNANTGPNNGNASNTVPNNAMPQSADSMGANQPVFAPAIPVNPNSKYPIKFVSPPDYPTFLEYVFSTLNHQPQLQLPPHGPKSKIGS